MSFFLVFDFETTGVGKDASNKYRPYPVARMPLPRANYPTQLAMELLDENYNLVKCKQMLIQGCKRLDPWVLENCPHISVKDCERDGVSFEECIKEIADMIGDKKCTMVAHNIQYDWDDVLLRTARELHLEDTSSFRKLASIPKYCTCINEGTKKEKTAYYWSKLGKWIGPKLSILAQDCGVDYDTNAAHDAAYDVRVTSQCLAHSLVK